MPTSARARIQRPRRRRASVGPGRRTAPRSAKTTTGDSAPVPCLGTLILHGDLPLGLLPFHQGTGSHVPHRSLGQDHATSTPDTAHTVSTFLVDSSRGSGPTPVLMSTVSVSTRLRWFTCVRLLDPHLTLSFPSAFSPTLTTLAFDQSSLGWFGTWPCNPVPRGLPSSSMQHRFLLSYLE